MKTRNETALYATNLSGSRPIILTATLALSLLGGADQFHTESAIKDSTTPVRLKEQVPGHSLIQAVRMARYAVEAVEVEPATARGGGCYAGNPAHALRCWFRADGLELQPAGTKQWKLNLRLHGYGRGALTMAAVGEVCARQNRVELSRANGAVLEWYENKAAGLEQGFTVRRAPPGQGPLRLLLETAGDLRPELDPASENTAVEFVAANGRATLHYSGLRVWDAAQRELAAHIELEGRQLVLVVNDRDAAYPVTIDPLITSQEAQLTADDGEASDYFGHSVSLSTDGNTALVGAYGDDTLAGVDAGSAYVFVRSDSGWSQQAKLIAADAAAGDLFGCSVSLSGDGSRALVGAYGDATTAGTAAGSAYVFVRSGTSWSQQLKLTSSDAAAYDYFGISVSLSRDGNTALAGAYGDNSGAGSAYVFLANGSNWTQQGKLAASDPANLDRFGGSVSLSADGNTALVGAANDDTPAGTDAGSAYVFVRSGTTWSQQVKLTADNAAALAGFGISVSLSSDGNTALVGAANATTPAGAGAGSVYVFVRSGTSWSQQAQLAAGGATGGDLFGCSVSLGNDGNRALAGAYGDDMTAGGNVGSAYVFARSGTNWSQQVQLMADDGTAQDNFGWSVALSGNGNTALVGARKDDTPAGTDAGSAYVLRLTTPPEGYNRLVAEALEDGAVRLTYLGLPGTNYALDLTFDLTPYVVWEPQATNPAGPSGYVILTNTPDPTMNHFWQMRSVP
jgi:hypothetical protein